MQFRIISSLTLRTEHPIRMKWPLVKRRKGKKNIFLINQNMHLHALTDTYTHTHTHCVILKA